MAGAEKHKRGARHGMQRGEQGRESGDQEWDWRESSADNPRRGSEPVRIPNVSKSLYVFTASQFSQVGACPAAHVMALIRPISVLGAVAMPVYPFLLHRGFGQMQLPTSSALLDATCPSVACEGQKRPSRSGSLCSPSAFTPNTQVVTHLNHHPRLSKT